MGVPGRFMSACAVHADGGPDGGEAAQGRLECPGQLSDSRAAQLPVRDRSAPDKSAPDKSAPDKSAPDKSAPDKSAPDKSAMNRPAPDKEDARPSDLRAAGPRLSGAQPDGAQKGAQEGAGGFSGMALDPGSLDAQLRRACADIAVSGSDPRQAEAARDALRERLSREYRRINEGIRQRFLANRDGISCARDRSRLVGILICIMADFAVTHARPPGRRNARDPLAIVAVGGFGRATLAPGSDIDLLFLHAGRQNQWTGHIISFVLYLLWDLGLKVGHAARGIADTIARSREDVTIRTALWDSRCLWGSRRLFDVMMTRFDRQVVAGSGAQFIAAKLRERDVRHKKYGLSRYLLEPNLKNSKGGLRDLDTLFWISKYLYRVRMRDDLVSKGDLSAAELALFDKCEAFLWSVRCAMHFEAGRAEDRLTFELQRAIAGQFGYRARAGQQAVERFMKHYFLVAKNVGDLTRIFAAALEARHARTGSELSRFIGHLTGRHRRMRRIDRRGDFIVGNERLTIAGPEVFRRDPANLIRLFHIASRDGLSLHPEAVKWVHRALPMIDAQLQQNPTANRLFLEILTSRNDPERRLRQMNETGVLGRFIPPFGRIVAMMQFSLYHHYTVDEHLIRSVGVLREIERGAAGEDHPLATDLIKTVQGRRALYVAQFLHDVAKGRGEDHSLAGAREVRALGSRFGLRPAETEMAAWLVENHLQMSTIAQTRDLSDARLIRDFAERVQSHERLKLLLILTVADIRAVGPGVFNGWKGQLLRTLYFEVEPLLTGGRGSQPPGERAAAARAQLAGDLLQWPPGDREGYLAQYDSAYWLRTPAPRQRAHAALVRRAQATGQDFASALEDHVFEGVLEITIFTRDRPHFLMAIARACAQLGAHIVDAQTATRADGFALDTICVRRIGSDTREECRRGRKIVAMTAQILENGHADGLPVMAESLAEKRRASFDVASDAVINNALSGEYTVVEVTARDRAGLLYDLTRTLAQLNLLVASAHIATYGERAVDCFYVTDLQGRKISNVTRQAHVCQALAKVAAGEGGTPL